MSTAQKMIEVARREIGVREGRDPNGNWNNRVKYNNWYVDTLRMGEGFRRSAWCAIFVSWVARHAGVPTSVIPNHAWTPSGDKFFANRGLKVSTPRAGDIFYVYYSSMGRVAHVGIVESYSNGWVTTIEGNTNNGQSRQGNGVYRLRRRVTSSLRFYRPRYGGSAPTPPKTGVSWDGKSFPGRNAFKLGQRHSAVTKLGERLVAHGFGKAYKVGPGPTFGEADRANTMAFQKAQGWTGSDADGYPGPETWKRLMAAPKAASKPASKPAKKTAPAFPSGLRPNSKRPSARALQRQLKRAGFMASSVPEADNYGPQTQRAVAAFHNKHAQFRGRGKSYDPTIGPRGWAFLFTNY